MCLSLCLNEVIINHTYQINSEYIISRIRISTLHKAAHTTEEQNRSSWILVVRTQEFCITSSSSSFSLYSLSSLSSNVNVIAYSIPSIILSIFDIYRFMCENINENKGS